MDRYAYNARRAIQLPVYLEEALAKIWAIQGELRWETGREPTQEEVARELGEGWIPEKVRDILGSVRNVWSLDEPMRWDEGEEGESYKKEGVWGSYKAPRFNGGIHGLPHVRRRRTYNIRIGYNEGMPREVSSTKAGRLKVGPRNGPAMLVAKAWGASRAPSGPGPSPDRAVGVDRPELTPLERTKVFAEGGSPPL